MVRDVEDLVSVLHAEQAVQVAPVAALEDLVCVVPGQRLQAVLVLDVVQGAPAVKKFKMITVKPTRIYVQ